MDESAQNQGVNQQPVVELQQADMLAPESVLAPDLRELMRFVATHNPFYVISAALIFPGLWKSFGQSQAMVETGALTYSLAAYVLLMATTAWLIIRLGHVWDDARTLLLLVVLMFLAISVSADMPLNLGDQFGIRLVLGGFAFAVAVSETLLRSLPLRLPALYRVPYYLVLALFFLYPAGLTTFVIRRAPVDISWALFAFSGVAGAVFLTLLPAVRRGRPYMTGTGIPWPWPAYPWTLFGTLGLCVCLRAYYLCISFHPIQGEQSIFGLYFLIPFALAVTVLVLEAAIVFRSPGTQITALVLPVFLPIMAVVGHRADDVYLRFLEQFQNVVHATPFYIAMILVLAYYGYAFFRGLPGAGNAFCVALAAFALVSPDSLDLRDLEYTAAWPLVTAGAIQFAIGLVRRESFRVTLGAALALVTFALDPTLPGGLVGYRGAIVWNVALVVVLLVAAIYRDEFAQLLRVLGAMMLTATCVYLAVSGPESIGAVPAVLVPFYPLLIVALAVVYGWLIGGPPYYAAAAAGALSWAVSYGWNSYLSLRAYIVGLNLIIWGVAFFAVATVISLAKAGLWARWLRRKETQT